MTAVRSVNEPVAASADARTWMSALLTRVRDRTKLLLSVVSDEDARLQHDPLMGPIVWDLGHVAGFERLWLHEQLDRPIAFGEMPGLYNPFEHPRAERGALPLPSLAAALTELDRVRETTLQLLETLEISDSPLLRDGFVFRMVAQHESQHQETMLQTLQLKQGSAYPAPRRWETPAPAVSDPEAVVRFPGGAATIGTHVNPWAYDNEGPAHVVEIAPFEIDRFAVTNGRYLEFMLDGGYSDERLWSDAGREWLRTSGCTAPKYWSGGGREWTERVMDRTRALDPMRPVCHVCFHEADAFARWAGKRLPTEFEWEVAATFDPLLGDREGNADLRMFDRHDANVDQLSFDTAPIGAYAGSASPLGACGLIGDVWEWTSSCFAPYPGFRSFPYPEYSEPFFGTEHRVLRGGSWATAANVARPTFRNWDYPIRRQIFAGFRCARDV